MYRYVLFSLFVLLCPCSSFSQTTTTLVADRDNTIYSNNVNASGGSGSNLYLGSAGNNGFRRVLLRFDLSGLPSNALITNVELDFNVNKRANADVSGMRVINLHRLLSDWGESSSVGSGFGNGAAANDATWTQNFFNSSTWTTPGGDFAANVSGSVTIGSTGSYTVASTAGMTDDVQAWMDGTAANFGWIMIGEEVSGQRNGRRLNSREVSANPPTLRVTYTQPLAAQEIDFTVAYTDQGRRVRWRVVNNASGNYLLESSPDGITFTERYRIDAATEASYEFVDFDTPHDPMYYRLLLETPTGNRQLLGLLHSTADPAPPRIASVQNPVVNTIRVKLESDRYEMTQVRLLEFSGKQLLLYQQQIVPGSNFLSLPFAGPPAGTYFLTLSGPDWYVTHSIIKI